MLGPKYRLQELTFPTRKSHANTGGPFSQCLVPTNLWTALVETVTICILPPASAPIAKITAAVEEGNVEA